MKKGTKGITLIALVITIIVLLILTGVTIATLTGENGILTKAGDAKTKTVEEQEKEEIKTAYAAAVTEKLSNGDTSNVTAGELNAELSKQDTQATATDGTKEGDIDVTFSETNHKYTVHQNGDEKGKITGPTNSQGQTPTPPVEEKLAKDVLKINPNATNDYEKSPYVKYNNILCRVFYNDTEHGLQIISADNMPEEVTLGSYDDFEKSKEDYNNAVDILNNKAKTYIKSGDGIAIDARSLGSIATLKDGKFQEDPVTKTEYKNDYDYFSEYNDQFKVADENYIEDGDVWTGQLQKLGLNVTSAWLASRSIVAFSTNADLGVFAVRSDGFVEGYWFLRCVV